MTSADAVADHLIALAHRRGLPVNNLKLQKLLYYAQAWHLALHDRPLFPEKFQAWIYGPAIPSVYRRFERFSWHDLPAPEAVPPLSGETRAFLDGVAAEYMPLAEFTLEDLARREIPWLNARGALPAEDPCSTEISEDDMRSCVRHVAEAA